MSSTLQGQLDAQGIKVALVVSRFNEFVTGRLLQGAEDCLDRHGCTQEQRTVIKIPGAWEIPQAARVLASSGDYDAVVALGALIRGETPHFDLLANEVARGLSQVGLQTGVPIAFGVLTTDTVEQAIDRAGAKAGNQGWKAALSAIEMVNLFRRMA
jgi:6,7-dimethyl-8-ribityllumazine synthase